jgi:Xaa-Pro aminopeptidase
MIPLSGTSPRPTAERAVSPPTDDCLSRRRERAAAAFALSDEIVLIGAGGPVGIPGGSDQTFPFLSHPEYFWLADRECAGGVMAFDPKEGWFDFVPAVTTDERVWEGKTQVQGRPMIEIAGWLAARHGRTLAMLGVPLPGAPFDAGRTHELRGALTHARRAKDAVELERMRRAVAATAPAFAVARDMVRPGVSEREIQIELEATFFRNGGDRTAYGTIVAAGSNAAVLHFNPTDRRLRPGDALLIDAGAEIGRYVSDVTRTYRAPGDDPGFFRELYQVVLDVEERGIERCVAGAEWRDIHLAAATELCEGLVAMNLLRGRADSLIEQDTHALFFPHGIGHMAGLGVRDASGFLPGRVRSTRPGLNKLRTDLPLESGYTMTMEPGIYFIRALLEDPDLRAKHKDAVNWARVDERLEFGGIRIEDNVIVTAGAPEVLTKEIPKQLE